MLKLNSCTRRLLEDIEERIDPETEEDFRQQWSDFLHHRFSGEIFTPSRCRITASELSHPVIHLNDTLEDMEAMLCAQLQGVSRALNSRSENLSVRASYGTGILPTVFGAELFRMPEESETLPTTRCLSGEKAMERLLDKGMPPLSSGLGRRVFETGAFFREVFSRYPKMETYVEIYHPDLQGPLDVCDLLWGEGLLYGFYDDPDMVLAAMQLITDTYLAFMEKWLSIVPSSGAIRCHWNNMMHRGQLVVRNDTAMNLSPECCREFVRPFDTRLMARYGGVIHFCGRGDHCIHLLKEIPGVSGVNLSQPHLNHMETSNTVAPAVCAAFIRAIELLEESTALRDKVHENVRYFRPEMEKLGFDLLPGEHPIVPVMLYDAKIAHEFARRMLEKGVYVVAFCYPVVPRGKDRIRIQISAGHTWEDLDFAARCFGEVKREMQIG